MKNSCTGEVLDGSTDKLLHLSTPLQKGGSLHILGGLSYLMHIRCFVLSALIISNNGAERKIKMQENDEDKDIIDMAVGDLVTVKNRMSGVKEKCFWPENWDKTITAVDNQLIPEGTIGMVVGFLSNYHTCMVTVAWGGDLGGTKLVIAGNHLIKATKNPK